MGMTVVEKILAKATGKKSVKAGEVLEPSVDVAMSHENAALVINQFNEVFQGTGIEPRVWNPDKIAIIFDHRVPAESSKTATNQKKIRDFVRVNKIKRFHDIRSDEGGICHQILAEYGYIRPGFVVVGTDSHTTTHGAFGAFAFGIGATEMASVWTLGRVLNVEVPDTIKVIVNGKFSSNVFPKDLILHLIGKISAQGANFKVLEFHGETIRNMPMSGRLVLSNMSVEAGATAGIIPGDSETAIYLKEHGVNDKIENVKPDTDANYCQIVEINASELVPMLACPHTVDNVKPVTSFEGKHVDQIVIGSCTNGRIDDLEIAANILNGKKVAHGTRMLIFPASWNIYKGCYEKRLS
jgi:3-isopropylmalate/(R)-2-methylmalate dehydratase large subunit